MARIRTPQGCVFAAVIFLAQACSSKDDEGCTLGTSDGCGSGQVCEAVAGKDEPQCFDPVEIHGRVVSASGATPVAGATLVALDTNGSARSSVALSRDDGSYSLPVSVQRDESGKPSSPSATLVNVTLRAAAKGFQAFPGGPRTALPIDLSTAVASDGTHVVMNAATDVTLIPLAGDSSNLGTLKGEVEADEPGGVLVVAEQGGKAVSSAVSDSDGGFTLFNVPAGATTVAGYRAGLAVTPAEVTATTGTVDDITLATSTSGLSTVSGSVNIVNAPGGSVTSVILVAESTFDENAARGESPAGLRAANVTGAFQIPGVAPGKYVVLAAFENDNLVRDPDLSIAGTQIVHITVPQDAAISQSFKVTEALAITSPGANGVEVISTAAPVFTWADDSSEDGYELRVYDALGNLVHEKLDIGGVSGSATVSYTWTSATLQPGMIYQFRVTSWKTMGGGGGSGRSYLSTTEDLRGVFRYQPAS